MNTMLFACAKIETYMGGHVVNEKQDAFGGTGKKLIVKVPRNKAEEYERLFKDEGNLKGSVKVA